MEQPRVSVVISTYGRPQLLSKTLGSILGQTYRDLEVVVASDGPSSEDRAVVEAFHDSRVTHLATERHAGYPAPARNLGIRSSTGALIAFCDDDDIWLPGKIARQVEALDAAPDAVLAHAVAYQMDEHGNDQGIRRPPPAAYDGHPMRGFLSIPFFHVLQSSIVVRRDVLGVTGVYNEHPLLKGREDTEFIVRLAARTRRRFVRPAEPLVRYRHAADSIGRSADYYRPERRQYFFQALEDSLAPAEHRRFVRTQFTIMAVNAIRFDRDWRRAASYAREAWRRTSTRSRSLL